MLMATKTETGNLAQVRDALDQMRGQSLESQRQPYPFLQWFMVVVRPGHDQQAADSFRRNGVRAYWPNYERIQTVRYRSNGNRPQQRLYLTPLMPGYVFSPAGVTQEDFTQIIERVVGVVKVVRTFSGAPLLLSEADIEIIRRIEAGLNTPDPIKPIHNYKTGEKVRFVDDIVDRWPGGKIVKLARDGRISVELDLMGRKVVVIVFPHQIERF